MTIAMPAITAKAANKLPRTPHFGPRNFSDLSLPGTRASTMILLQPAHHLVDGSRVEYRGTRLIKSGESAKSFNFAAPNAERPARGRPFLIRGRAPKAREAQ